jgi:hypothetical protein
MLDFYNEAASETSSTQGGGKLPEDPEDEEKLEGPEDDKKSTVEEKQISDEELNQDIDKIMDVYESEQIDYFQGFED